MPSADLTGKACPCNEPNSGYYCNVATQTCVRGTAPDSGPGMDAAAMDGGGGADTGVADAGPPPDAPTDAMGPVDGGTPRMVEIIGAGAVWYYDERNVDLTATSWTTTPGPFPPLNREGAQPLGFGSTGSFPAHATLLEDRSGADNNTPVYYLRRTVTLDAIPQRADITYVDDDGFAVFVNGTLVYHHDLGSPPNLTHSFDGPMRAGTPSSGTAELGLSPNPFVVGDNIVAVLLKNATIDSTDVYIDVRMTVHLSP